MATVIKWEGVEVATVQSVNQESPYADGKLKMVSRRTGEAVSELKTVIIRIPGDNKQKTVSRRK